MVSGLNKWQASTLGLATVYQWLNGSLQLHQRAMREVRASSGSCCPPQLHSAEAREAAGLLGSLSITQGFKTHGPSIAARAAPAQSMLRPTGV